jgi:hypothetical protein
MLTKLLKPTRVAMAHDIGVGPFDQPVGVYKTTLEVDDKTE